MTSTRLPARATPVLLVLLVLGALLVPVVAPRAQQGPDFASVRGDVTLDTAVSVIDALAVLRTAVGTTVPDSFRVTPNGDTNCDLGITALDALIILSEVVGLDVSAFCIGDPLVASLDLTPDSSRLIRGDSLQLGATTLDDGGAALTRDVAYSSLDPAVATVDSTGLVVTFASGTVRVAAVSEEVHDTTELTVLNPPVAIIVTPTVDTMNTLGETQALSASVRDSTGAELQGLEVAWASSDPGVATVDSVGVVRSVAAGLADITATFRGVTSNAVGISVEPLAVAYCGGAGATIHDSDIVVDQTWTEAASPHRVTQDFTVHSGATLTVEAGSIVCIDQAHAITFDGGVLDARGTPTDSIFFVPSAEDDHWRSLAFQGFPADTSRIGHAILQQGGRFAYVLATSEGHMLEVDSSLVTGQRSDGVLLEAPGGRIRGSVLEGGSSGDGLRITARATVEDVVLRDHPINALEMTSDSVVVRDVTILRPGTSGIVQSGTGTGVVFRNIRVEDPGDRGLWLSGVLDTIAGIRVRGTGGFVYYGPPGNLAQLLVDGAAQDSLVDGTADTLAITGGTLSAGDTVEVRPGLVWRFVGSVTVADSTVLSVLPGTTTLIDGGHAVAFDEGGRLSALGTAAEPVRFRGTGVGFNDIRFETGSGGGPDTSRIVHGVVENGGRFSWALSATESHALLVDSTTVRQSVSNGVRLAAPGSRFVGSVVDTVGSSGDGVQIEAAATLEGSTVRASGIGIDVIGSGATLRDFVVENTEQEGVRVSSGSGHVIADGHVDGAGSYGMRITAVVDSVVRMRILNGAIYPVSARIEQIRMLAPTPTLQDSLLGNARDSIVVDGGTLAGDTATVRSDIPWIVTSDVSVADSAVLLVQPGGLVAMNDNIEFFFNGGRLDARGTLADSVRFRGRGGDFCSLWFQTPSGGAPDTSVVRYAAIEDSRAFCWALRSQDQHTLLVDSSVVRRADGEGVLFQSPGSRIHWSVVDSVGGDGVQLGLRSSLVGTTVRRAGAIGIDVEGDSAEIRDFLVEDAGTFGLDMVAGGVGHRVVGGRIVNSGSEGLRATVALDSLAGIRVEGSGSWGARLTVDNLAKLAPTPAEQDSLAGNARADSILVDGGTLRRDTLEIRPDFPWLLIEDMDVLDSARLVIQPGASLTIDEAHEVNFDLGGRLLARGTPTDSVRIAGRAPGAFWNYLVFRSRDEDTFGNTFPDTSWVTNAVVEGGARGGFNALESQEIHTLIVDSVAFRSMDGRPVRLASPGSRISRSLLAPNLDDGGLWLSDGAVADSVTIDQPAGVGLYINGDSATARDVTVLDAGGDGIFVDNGVGHRLERPRVDGAGGHGLRIDPGVTLDTLVAPFVTGAGTWGLRTSPQNLDHFLFARTDLDSLRGNLRDSLFLEAGTFRGDSLWSLVDYPLVVAGDLSVLDSAVLWVEPGASIEMQPSTEIFFDEGGRLDARGTPTDSVRIVERGDDDFWQRLSFASPPPDAFGNQQVDTSRISFAVIERGAGSGWTALEAQEAHVLLVDSSDIRSLGSGTSVRLDSRGSRVLGSFLGQNQGGVGVRLDEPQTSLEETVIEDVGSYGVWVTADSVLIRDVTVRRSGDRGIFVDAGTDARIEGARVEDPVNYGVYLEHPLDTISGLFVTGSTEWGFRSIMENLEFFDTREKLDSLLGNTRDTLLIDGGVFAGDTLWVRPDLPLLLNGFTQVLDSAVLKIEAGGALLFNGNQDLTFDDGGKLHARGTPAEKVVIGQRLTNDFWDQMTFASPPPPQFAPQEVDTSWITNAVVSRGANSSTFGLNAIDSHVLLVDSTEILQFDNQPVSLGSAGSAIRRSRLEDNVNGHGVTLGDSTEISNSAVRGMEDDGIRVTGDSVVVDHVEVSGNGGVGINVLSADPSRVTITMCNIEGNTGVGVFNATAGTVIAEDNWWGDAGGPEVDNGDGVDADVDFEPFLASPVTIPFLPGG